MKCLEFKILYSSCPTPSVCQIDHHWRRPPREFEPSCPSTYLARRIDYFRSVVLSFVFDYLTESVLDCRVVTLDKVAVNELDSKGGFAYRRAH